MADRPRGTRDFTPADMAVRREAEARLRDVFAGFGYGEVQTPVFEHLELFTAKSGEGIISELYDFTDKGERRMALRPELTAPVMRMYFADHAFDPKPIKWFYHGPCYRYDRPQEGRYREFWQFGCEQIGAGTPLAYAELVALGAACFEALGLQDIEIRVGHVALLRGAVDALGLDDAARGALMRAIDKRDMDAVRETIAGAPKDAAHGLMQMIGSGEATGEHADQLAAVMDHLAAFGIEAVVDLGIARGLDYYTGIVFEMHTAQLDAQSQLLGGGGYDLSHVFGGKATPTMGFGLGFDRALVALAKQGGTRSAPSAPVAYFGALSAQAQAHITPIVADLRRRGIPVDMDLMGRANPSKLAKAADAVGARFLVVIGDRDLEAGQVTVKQLDSGAGETIALADVRAWFLEQTGVDLRDYN